MFGFLGRKIQNSGWEHKRPERGDAAERKCVDKRISPSTRLMQFFFGRSWLFSGSWVGKNRTRNGNPRDRSRGTLPNENASKTNLSLNKTNAFLFDVLGFFWSVGQKIQHSEREPRGPKRGGLPNENASKTSVPLNKTNAFF